MDEYDPMRPNDYDRMTRKDRELREKQKEIDRYIVMFCMIAAQLGPDNCEFYWVLVL